MVQGATLEDAQYYIRTKLGISTAYAKHTRELPWFGTGQGAGNAAIVYLLIEDSVFHGFTAQAKGATYITPDGSYSFNLHILGFVDDCNNRANNDWKDPTQTTEDLVAKATSKTVFLPRWALFCALDKTAEKITTPSFGPTK